MQDVGSPCRHGGMTAAIAALVLFCAAAADAQDWAKKMFDRTTNDFGTVARGAKVECRFVVENIYEEDAHIDLVTSSCHCSTPRIVGKQLLKTWEKTEIAVAVDTRAEPGRKDGTITVIFDRPFRAEVQLHVHSYIRGDVVVQPGAAEFGSVNQGTEATKTLGISYAGRDDWRIDRVECANPHIVAGVVETSRTPGQIAYNLSVKLKPDAPPGYLRDQLMLVTNDLDPQKTRVPVGVEGLVAAALTVRPASLALGAVEVGKPRVGNLVVQGRAPFRVLAVRSTDDRFQCKQCKTPTDVKTFHILPITFLAKDAKAATEKVRAKIRIETDLLGGKLIEVDAEATVKKGN